MQKSECTVLPHLLRLERFWFGYLIKHSIRTICFLHLTAVKHQNDFRAMLHIYAVLRHYPGSKSKPCFGCETKTGVVRILVIFQDRPMFSHIIQKVSARAFH